MMNKTYNATRYGSDFELPIGVGQIHSRYIAQQLMKNIFSIVSKLSAKRFAGLHSDWPKHILGSQALV